MKRLKPKRSLGPPKIPPYIYKACMEFLTTLLTYFFDLRLVRRVFPGIWKITKITPKTKRSGKHQQLYRPIALFSVPTKIFESVIKEEIYEQIRSQITPEQHGFVNTAAYKPNMVNLLKKY